MAREGNDGRVHDVVVHETPDPRVFGVECTCGYRQIAFFGEPNVELVIDRHYAVVGVTKVMDLGRF